MRLEEGKGAGEGKSRVILVISATRWVRKGVVRGIPVGGQQLILPGLTQRLLKGANHLGINILVKGPEVPKERGAQTI